MALSRALQNPRTINKIDPVDKVALTPPTGLAAGKRVLIADPKTGDHNLAVGTGDFAGNTGKIATSNGIGGWNFENKTLYLDNQLVPVGDGREIWLYWQATGQFERATGSEIRQEYNEYMGYLRNQAGNPNYVWTQHSLSGTAIVPRTNSYEFELNAGYAYNIRHRIIATRAAAQDIAVGIFIDGAEVGNSFYGSNPNNYSGSGTFEYRLKIPTGTGVRILDLRDLTGATTDNHDAILSVEAVAIDASTALPQTRIDKSLGFIHYSATAGSQALLANTVIPLDSIGITANNVNATSANLQETIGPGVNYVRLPYAGSVTVQAQTWNTSATDQRVMLVQENSGGAIKRQWGNFLTTIPSRATNTAVAFDVAVGDRIYLKTQTAFTYDDGLTFTELAVSYLAFN